MPRPRRRLVPAAVLALILAGCAPPGPPALPDDAHLPPFARVPYEPFSRKAAVQIALREWRAFGRPVVVPGTPLPFDNERAEGLWQRIGEYWWLGLPLGVLEQAWTGKHDEAGRLFPPERDADFAWSAAFIDYVMRMAGAGRRFPYSPLHADYINAAKRHAAGREPELAITAEPPQSYAPQLGDLICYWRGSRPLAYDDLPAGRFAGHCDIVVARHPGSLDVIGGNVDNSVALKHVPVAPGGLLAGPDGVPIDPDHHWFVVIRVEYALSTHPVS
jgi:hypothetical protein